MIDWKKHPKAAYADVTFFDEHHCDVGSQLDISRPTQKTVADAVEYCKENGKICGYSFSQNKMLSFCKSNGTYCFVSEKSSAGSVETDDWQPICTREQFEAYVKEQESEKWTHTYNGDICKIIHQVDGDAWIKFKSLLGSLVVRVGQLKPIKPTISESELLHKIKDMGKGVASNGHFGDTVRGWLDKYDII